ncbi:o-succinylbenzoate--CoA ligase [Alicyclobacillus sp. SO9]|uniref:o-succinylbenzoate--CoA ligase n=1 Tax=Alicyclobacillus sp. SO9 TaxID=2665646 RepID=UPI0018E83EC5|nr:o-succinylbenzoate--CoA ligase [Alicyclobacillus sp. SO9]QQE77164.1 o-succinylbenzoate--CoA ligase [Alicyclobacillus sp. SO9]
MEAPATWIPDWLHQRKLTHPDVAALSTPSGTFSYRELHELATGMAGALRQRKVTGRVGVLAKDGHLYALSVHALIQAQLTITPLNWRLRVPELAWQLQDAKVSWLLHDTEKAAEARELQKHVAGLQLINLAEMSPVNPGTQNTHINLNHVHAVIYTSGTTGRPKGAQLTFGNEWWSAVGAALQLGTVPGDKWLVPMPLFHVGGMSVLLRCLIYGATAVIHNGFDAALVNEAIDNEGISLVSVVPTMLQRMFDEHGESGYPSSLRAVLLGGSAASKGLLERAQELGVPVAQSYGLTETSSQVCTLSPADGLKKIGSSGLPSVMNEVIIVNPQARQDGRDPMAAQRPPLEPGEIVVRGPSVFGGYLNRPEETRAAISGDWLWTGDVGYQDSDGYLYVLDRRKDMIVSGGENIYPAEIESVLEKHENIAEAAVVGVTDQDWGQVPLAVIVPCGKAVSTSELQDYCRKQLAGYKVPKDFIEIEHLPRNASGKLLRRILQEWLEKDWQTTKH